MSIHINQTPVDWIPTDPSIKHFGLHFDTHLTWNTDFNKTLNKVYARLTQIYPLINRKTPLKHAAYFYIND